VTTSTTAVIPLDQQIETYVRLGYPALAGLDEEGFREIASRAVAAASAAASAAQASSGDARA